MSDGRQLLDRLCAADGKPLASLLTVNDVATHLKVSERTVRREVRARRLRCVRIGRRLLFDPADVARFVAARKE